MCNYCPVPNDGLHPDDRGRIPDRSHINRPLLRETLQHLIDHPDDHDQAEWRCGTNMCFGGRACDLAGGRWAFSEYSFWARYLLPEPGDHPDSVEDVNGIRVGDAAYRAARVLGLDRIDAEHLFYERLGIDDITDLVEAICSGREDR